MGNLGWLKRSRAELGFEDDRAIGWRALGRELSPATSVWPTLDFNRGKGAGAPYADEHIEVDSLVERAKLQQGSIAFGRLIIPKGGP